jgi:hypothetical protein
LTATDAGAQVINQRSGDIRDPFDDPDDSEGLPAHDEHPTQKAAGG